jgi:hypothetical protein
MKRRLLFTSLAMIVSLGSCVDKGTMVLVDTTPENLEIVLC